METTINTALEVVPNLTIIEILDLMSQLESE
jgi:hypothetical protein